MTIKEWLEKLATSTESTEEDGASMQNFLRQYGFPSAVVTCGIVYLEGHGTYEAPPSSIHSIARMLLKILVEKAGGEDEKEAEGENTPRNARRTRS